MAEDNENVQVEDSTEQNGGIEQIREIVVGENLRAIQASIEHLQSQINELKGSLGSFRDEADEFNKNFQQSTSQEFEKTQQELQQKHKTVENSIAELMNTLKLQIKRLDENKVDKSRIGQVFMEWGMKMKDLQQD